MKKIALLIALLLLFSACSAEEALPDLTAEEAYQYTLTRYNLNLIDLRSEEAYTQGHLPYALSIPLAELEGFMNELLDSGFENLSLLLLVYSDSVSEAAQGAQILRNLEFTNVFTFPGLENWPGEVLTLEEDTELRSKVLGHFKTQDLYGNPVDYTVLNGHKLTMVNVWATYCGPCINEMPELGKLNKDYAEQGFQIIGMVCDISYLGVCEVMEDGRTEAQQIVEKTGADYLHILPDATLVRNIMTAVSSIPLTFFVDEEGTLVGNALTGSRSYEAWASIIESYLNIAE